MYNDVIINSSGIENSNSLNSNSNNFDVLFDNLTNDINNVNKFISDLNDQQKANNIEEKELLEERERINRAKQEFESYMNIQKKELDKEKKQNEQYLEFQKENLLKAEEEFRINMNSSLTELELAKKELELQKEKMKEEKEQFEAYKNLELNRIRHSEEILLSEKNQFEKYKEVTNKKIELENKNLEQKCIRFKEIIGQFNSNFRPILENKNE